MPDAACFPPRRAPRPIHPAPGRAGAFGTVMAALLIAGAAHAQTAGAKKEDTSCAQYGAGFQKIPGSTSCVRTGATVRVDAFGGSGLTSAPNQFGGTPSGSGPAASTTSSDPWKSAR
ncbi:porin [Xanthobacter autotrophicus]|uniref:hypothetical protein n=1 Tax=Xanthobacter TaxID=279 RepID=UPI0024AC6291|nr:hypothetical protein [Xanthobacter autotrophicus]MDI4665268.1 porin [Xanthobacter autotrophicus]